MSENILSDLQLLLTGTGCNVNVYKRPDAAGGGVDVFLCAFGVDKNGEGFAVSVRNVESALAAMTQERDALKKDQGDWRQGVKLIASALGEKTPPNLSCVRIAVVALNLRVSLEEAEAKDG